MEGKCLCGNVKVVLDVVGRALIVLLSLRTLQKGRGCVGDMMPDISSLLNINIDIL